MKDVAKKVRKKVVMRKATVKLLISLNNSTLPSFSFSSLLIPLLYLLFLYIIGKAFTHNRENTIPRSNQ